MFGYVTICRECMSDEEYDIFSAYYCGLCRETGRRCSQISRLGLSYDITFLAIVLSSMSGKELLSEEYRCPLHPKKKRITARDDEAVSYAADVGTILSYLKLADDWYDDRSVKALFAMAGLYGGMQRARKNCKKQYDTIKYELKRLGEYERSGGGIDESADCFAKILECLFAPDFITDKTQRRVLGWFGYNLGRWIYVIDAFNDIEKDKRNHSYNPFLINAASENVKAEAREKTVFSLTFNLHELASAFELLDIKKNDGILRNVIYTGLKAKQNKILGEKYGSV